MIDRALTDKLDAFLAGGGAGPSTVVAIFTINDREFARVPAPAMSAEQARLVGYTIQRG